MVFSAVYGRKSVPWFILNRQDNRSFSCTIRIRLHKLRQSYNYFFVCKNIRHMLSKCKVRRSGALILHYPLGSTRPGEVFGICRIQKKCLTLRHQPYAVVAQLVEHQLPKLRVAGSNPVYRSIASE